MPFHQNYVRVEQPAFGQLIRELRHTLKLTQERFAAQLGVTFPTINRWENGHATPSPLALKQINLLLNQMAHSDDATLQQCSQAIHNKYFSSRELEA